ncbi:MAG: alpha/beta hydrolase [Spirochaetes bacterium]|nr:alpha/beta hydrolase [Spirochaetota bacterium]MBN2770618.1 alpha/beta hydrolase [Spirochaetota bacterium]
MKKRATSFLIIPATLFVFITVNHGEKSSNHGNKNNKHCVILLHGLARTESSMNKMEQALINEGYHVINKGYPSRSKEIQPLSEETISNAINECVKFKPGKIHFVTHSMGGILVRYYLDKNRIKNLGRVVMLSPPNRGSETVDKLKSFPPFNWLNGPAGQQLGTGSKSIPNQIGSPDYEVGIITGDRSINPILSLLIPGDDDGKVSIERAKLAGMKDFIVVHNTHTFIMSDKDVIKQVIYFIRNGLFDKSTIKK